MGAGVAVTRKNTNNFRLGLKTKVLKDAIARKLGVAKSTVSVFKTRCHALINVNVKNAKIVI